METVKEVRIIKPTVGQTINRKIRAAAYCRVSTDSEDQFNSFLAQLKYYTDFVKNSDNMELVDIYADEGITGTCVNKREDFKRMIHDASLGKIDRIFVKSVSRFARNSLECLEAIRKLMSYGVTVLFENDNIDTKAMNSELVLYVKSAFAQSESLAGSKRVSTAIRMKMENGEFTTYTAPYGYKLVNLNLVIEPNEAEVVRRIFSMYLQGLGTCKIAATLNKQGIDCKGHSWTVTGVRYILSNEKYIGDSILQKTYTPQMLPLRNRPNNGQLDKYYVENTHEPIVGKDVFAAVQQRLAENNNQPNRNKGTEYLLSGMIQCGECGWTYKRKVQRGVVYWVCSQKGIAGFICGGNNLREEAIFDAFVEVYNKLRCFEKEILDGTLSLLLEVREKIAGSNTEITQIDAEIAKLSEQNTLYAELRNKAILDDVSFQEKVSGIQNRLTELRSRRLKLLNSDDEGNTIENLRVLKDSLADFPVAITSFDKPVFYAVVDKIIAGNDSSITFITKGGLKLKHYIRS